MIFKELECIKIKKDYLDYKIKKGDMGTVLECFQKPEEAYLVEFADSSGESICTEFFKPDELEKII